MVETAASQSSSSEAKAHEKQGAFKIVCDVRELLDAVGMVARVAPPKGPRPILSNILFQTRDGTLEVLGTDLEIALRVRVERVEVAHEGTVLVNAARTHEILKEFQGERVELEADESSGCVLKAPDARYHVLGEDPLDYPDLPRFDEKAAKQDGTIELRSSDLVDMVAKTHFAAAVEKTRYAMNGILLDLKDKRFRLVATDGKRLALAERPLEQAVPKPVFVVIPTKGLTLMGNLLGTGDETVAVRVEESQVFLRTSRGVVAARLVEGHFPPYEDVLPRALDKQLDLSKESFAAALRRASLLTTRESLAVRFRFSRDGLELTARVPEVGESRVRFPLDYPYEPLEVGFNPQYLQDVLRVVDSETFRLELRDSQSAALVKGVEVVPDTRSGEGAADDARVAWREIPGFVYVIMPINLG